MRTKTWLRAAGAAVAAALVVAPRPAAAAVRGVVEVSGLAPIPITVAPATGPGGADAGARLAAHLRRSHWFELVPPAGPAPGRGLPPPLPPGANFAVSAAVEVGPASAALAGFIHSADGTRQFGREYRVDPGDEGRALRRFADDVVFELTGVTGLASSTIAFVADHEGQPAIFTTTPDGAAPRRVASGAFECLFPRFRRGGTELVYTAFPRDFPELMWLDTATGENRAVSSRPGLNSLGAISPDGTLVAATLSFEGNPEVYLLDRNGGVVRRLTDHRGSDLSPAWSPDGRRLAFVSDRAGKPAVYLVDAEGGEPRRVTHGFDSTAYATEPAFSPRGDFLAFSGRGAGGMDIWVHRLSDGEFFRVTEGGGDEEAPEWAPDNRHLVVATRSGPTRAIEVIDVRRPSNRYKLALPGLRGLRDPTWGAAAPGGSGSEGGAR